MNSSTLKQDAIGGVTTFFTMAYIIVVNPAILATEGTGMSFTGVMTATVLLSAGATMLMGLYAKIPFALAPGMGLNAFFTYTIVLGEQVPWQTALGMVAWSGLLFLILSLTPLRMHLARAIPVELRKAAAVGIGIFLAFIGLKNAKFVVDHPATFLTVGPIGHEVLFAIGAFLVICFLCQRKNPLAFLVGIFGVTLVAWLTGNIQSPEVLVSMPDFHSVMFQLDLVDALRWALLPAIISLFFTDLFDTMSTFLGVSQATGMLDEEGQPINMRKGLLVDAIATVSSGFAGSSPTTTFIESAAGVEAGGRSGRSAIITGLCFLPCLFLAPLAGMVPAYATAPVLVFVGFSLFRTIGDISMKNIETAIPVFLTILLIPLTFSITQGILWGFLSYSILHIFAGKARTVSPIMHGLAGVSGLLLLMENWKFLSN